MPKKLTRGERVCKFIETYVKNPEGALIGKPMKLEKFEVDFILDIYDNQHITHTAILSMARKNGKTSLIAALLLAHTVGPEAVLNSQIVSGARSRDQAAVVFELAAKMIQLDPDLSRVARVMPSGKRIIGLSKNVIYRALAADGKTAHGLSPILVILDELGQVKGPTDDFVSALTSAQGAYENPLLIVISTQAPTDADMLSTMIDAQRENADPHVVCHVYEAPVECRLDDEEAWKAANPGLGVFRSIEDVRKQCSAAMAMPANEPAFRNLILNQRVESSAPFVSRSVWESNGDYPGESHGKRVWCGLDLSSVNDLTAFVMVDEDFGVHCRFWLPEHGIAEKSRKDKVPYNVWANQEILTLTPGKAIEYEYIANYLISVFDSHDVQCIAFDRYNFKFLKPWLQKAGLADEEIDKFVEFGQGTASMTPALRELESKLLNAQLKHGNNPILNMCAANAKVVGDSGARKFDKKTARGRIDGMVALAMAVGVMPEEIDGGCVYDYAELMVL